MTPTPSPQLKFTPNIPLVILSLVLLPALISLGVWQLGRAEEKRSIEAALNARQTQAPINLDWQTQLAPYTRVIARGRFDNNRIWLVDNRQRGGRVGYEVVQPLRLTNGFEVLVNRGWVQAPAKREQIPSIEPLIGEHTVFASVAALSDHPMLSAKSQSEQWPKIITQIAPQEMLGTSKQARSYYLNIDSASVGALRTEWKAVNMKSSKHTGYAVQWFAMALALFVLSIIANTNIASVWQYRKNNEVK
ncbi:SURF1 family protein [Gilvimarinus sp. 1_MG-2023]|uniref:SURF1 family protein n=1 Tax=Gilvimarinus sp. 1_MG-2023 TaxID=3062638 RepID=UPI0026E2987C|nr:SURF1 family protein [Gilvimarinus sp. 1_MG-2023]MDO6747560.1 SURF1 family protein [Gilvimarinus sp. 1_MG-2023]